MNALKSIFIFLIFCFVFFGASFAKAHDSSIEELKKLHEKINYFNTIENQDSIRYYLNIGFKIAQEQHLRSDDPKDLNVYVGKMYFLQGMQCFRDKDFVKALSYYEKATIIFKEKNEKIDLARSLNNSAVIYLKTGNQAKSLESLHASTSIFIDYNDSVGITQGYINISKIYRDQNDLNRSNEYLQKALCYARKMNNPELLSTVLNAYAGIKKELEDQEGALKCYQEALEVSKLTNRPMKTALVLNNIGAIYNKLGEIEKALIHLNKANKMSVKYDSKIGVVYTNVNIAENYLLRKDFNQALVLANEAYALSKEIQNREAELKAIEGLIEILKAKNEWKQVAEYQKKLMDYQDIRESQIMTQISQNETIRYKLETEKVISESKQLEAKLIREKENQQLMFYYIIVLILFIVLFVFSFIILIRLKTTKEVNKNIIKQSEERKLLLQEVHHRVKNNFQIVSSMLRLQSYNFDNPELQENFEEAVNRINAMAIVHDVIYRQEKFKDIDAKIYLEKLVQNLHQLGDSRIDISIVSEEIPFKIETLINLGIAINEMITNSFKHAFNSSIDHPEIHIYLKRLEESTFELKYKDNGVGFDAGNYESNFGTELIETIISNYDGEVNIGSEGQWNTVYRLTFKEI